MLAKQESHSGSHEPAAAYQLKITLSDLRPPIWRRVLVREDINLGLLHTVIQVAMGWTNSHLHQFLIGELYYSDPASGLNEYAEEQRTLDESRAILSQLAPHKGGRFSYEYDFGDSWHHEIRVEKIQAPDPSWQTFVECLGGARACPPEDCGGAPRYEQLLETLKHPKSEQYEEIMDWLGGSFDPEAFDLQEVNRYLRKLKWPRTTIAQLGGVLMQRDDAKP
jgi:hypothetical protein